jgi:hypothetical protein
MNTVKAKHPKALPFLFFSEMWERFGYYLMIGIFTLYLKDVKEGFAMNEAESADLYGTFYCPCIPHAFYWGFIGRSIFWVSQINHFWWIVNGCRLLFDGGSQQANALYCHDPGDTGEWFF